VIEVGVTLIDTVGDGVDCVPTFSVTVVVRVREPLAPFMVSI
jgi:hypothetical protein